MLHFFYLFNKDIIVNSYQLNFPSSPFSSQQNKKIYHPSTFPPLQLNTNKEKLNLSIFPLFHSPTIFYLPTFPSPQPNRPLVHYPSFTPILRLYNPLPKKLPLSLISPQTFPSQRLIKSSQVPYTQPPILNQLTNLSPFK